MSPTIRRKTSMHVKILQHSHIVAAALSTFRLKSISDTPSESVLKGASELWMKTNDERKVCMEKLCTQVFDKFVSLTIGTASKDYTHSSKDGVSSYALQLLRIGCLYMEFADVIREGDGDRVLRCWCYFLPIFRAAHCTNYACESLQLLHQHLYSLSSRLSNQLLWGRFINVRGLPGNKIPLDLHMEHLNRISKDAIRNLGSNKSVAAITRVGRSIGTFSPVLYQFDSENQVNLESSKYRKPHATEDIAIAVEELLSSQTFYIQDGRKYRHFAKTKDLLTSVPQEELVHWIMERFRLQSIQVRACQ